MRMDVGRKKDKLEEGVTGRQITQTHIYTYGQNRLSKFLLIYRGFFGRPPQKVMSRKDNQMGE